MTRSDDQLLGRNDKHAKRELRIFREFASLCPFDINADSVRKQVPPAPDIACALSNGEGLEFELVEILDSDIARLDNDALSLGQSYTAEFKALPVAERSLMEANLADAYIVIDYGRSLRLHDKRGLIPEILRLLKDVPRQYRGNLNLSGTIGESIRRVTIRRGDITGPEFDIVSAGSFQNPIDTTILDKLAKVYEVTGPAELLAYNLHQPTLPQDTWLPAITAILRKSLAGSAFRRVWIYDASARLVLFVHPEAP